MKVEIILICLLCITPSITVIVKTDAQKSKINKTQISKHCIYVEECHPCTFDELKHNDDDCISTGFKKRKHCIYENGDERYFTESCNENMGINSVYIMFILCICLCVIAWKVQKQQKDSTLKHIFAKLSIFKDVNVNK